MKYTHTLVSTAMELAKEFRDELANHRSVATATVGYVSDKVAAIIAAMEREVSQ